MRLTCRKIGAGYTRPPTQGPALAAARFAVKARLTRPNSGGLHCWRCLQQWQSFETRSGGVKRPGQALVPVVFVAIILTVMVVAFATSATREVRAGSGYCDTAIRNEAAQGALNLAAAALSYSSNNGATYGLPTPDNGVDGNGWMQIGGAWVKIEAVDTAAFLNLNTADQATLGKLPAFSNNTDLSGAILDWRTPPPTAGDQSASGAQPGTPAGGAAAAPGVATSDYYETLRPPYDAKQAPFDTVDELMLVKGFTPAVLFGDINGNSPSNSPGSQSPGFSVSTARTGGRQALSPGPGAGGSPGTSGNAAGTGSPSSTSTTLATQFDDIFQNSRMQLAEMFTTVCKERNVAVDGSPRVNINTATEQDLEQKAGLTAGQAQQIVSSRGGGNSAQNQSPGGTPGSQQGAPPPGGGAVAGQPGVPPASAGPGTVATHRLLRGRRRRQALGLSGGGAGGSGAGSGGSPPPTSSPGATQPSTGTGSGYNSIADLLNVPGFDRNALQQVADRLTTDPATDRTNVFNINTAPPEVLALVPGMDRPTLDAIMAYRSSGQVFQTIGDLFNIKDISTAELQAVVGSLCTKSSFYRVRLLVRSSPSAPVTAVQALVEMTVNGPQIRQYQVVQRSPGWSNWTPPATLPRPMYGYNSAAGSNSSTSAPGH